MITNNGNNFNKKGITMGVNNFNKKEKRTIVYMISLITQIGISMIVPILLCTFIGVYINKYVDKPIIVLVFIMIGCVTSFRNVYVLIKSTFASDMKRENEELEYFKELERAREHNLNKHSSIDKKDK